MNAQNHFQAIDIHSRWSTRRGDPLQTEAELAQLGIVSLFAHCSCQPLAPASERLPVECWQSIQSSSDRAFDFMES